MSATCGRNVVHSAHVYFYDWPRQSGVCDGKVPTPDTLAYALVKHVRDEVRRELLDELKAYVEGAELKAYVEGAREDVPLLEDRWWHGYREALTNVALYVERRRSDD